MTQVMVGQRAPAFRLPSAQGREIGTEDFRGRNLILFFAKGMACGFCRQNMSQLARGLSRFRELDTEVLQVAPTPVDRGRFYGRSFQLPFPYLCDPDYRVYATYGLGRRKLPLLTRLNVLYGGLTAPTPPNDWGEIRPSLREVPRLASDEDMGFFIADRDGVIRYARTGSYVIMEGGKPAGIRPIPSNEEIVRELERCHGASV
jgi:peroxiredoxin